MMYVRDVKIRRKNLVYLFNESFSTVSLTFSPLGSTINSFGSDASVPSPVSLIRVNSRSSQFDIYLLKYQYFIRP